MKITYGRSIKLKFTGFLLDACITDQGLHYLTPESISNILGLSSMDFLRFTKSEHPLARISDLQPSYLLL